MTRKEALAELIAKVEAGEWDAAGWGVALSFDDCRRIEAKRAFQGSLDAAKALHEAVLPGWIVHDFSQNSRSMGWSIVLASKSGAYATSHQGGNVGFCDNPARAWLLAILRAQHAQEDSGSPADDNSA